MQNSKVSATDGINGRDRLNGGKLTARTFQSQQNEIAIQIDALNRSIRAAKPDTIRIR